MKVGFIGGGNMAEAMIRGIVASGSVAADDVLVNDLSEARCAHLAEAYGIRVCSDNQGLVAGSRVVILAVKPQGLSPVLEEIAEVATPDHLVISIAAGKRTEGIAAQLPGPRLVRVMPNLPATVGEGMSAYCLTERVTDEDRYVVRTLLASFGKVLELPEEQFDAVTAVSGSGPAFFAHFLALVIEAGEALGLDPDDAALLAEQTMQGTAQLLSERPISPAELVEAVSSKKGTTEAGMAQLSSPVLTELVRATLRAAANRCRELSA
ncbi:MAG: pyrroline-5-carboxylate reductase [Kiritimatiellia bacterium]|jgi:pyrroline-5-carboxylate reductase|nr:pyrroline-5-carboxylate reductase [Pseudomonadales bacterium]MDP6809520.1 pyrroline-5-carboxylate reductase [Kiritimatiellia bacterium]MDP7022664.1 pyrroline-5-carboxylate reductase [Kiritimatiellia bacterium]